MNEYDLEGIDASNKEGKHMLNESLFGGDDYQPIQKNAKLFKFILYTSKVEIKSNSLIKLIYSTSLFELSLWIVGLLLFISSPYNMFLIWVLIVHVAKSILGFTLLSAMPKTYEIIENLAKNPNFQEDQIMELIQAQVRESFMERWTQNKRKLMFYFIATILCLVIDVVIFIVQIILFGGRNWQIMQTSLLFIILVFIGKLF
jgi:hypothetical protein